VAGQRLHRQRITGSPWAYRIVLAVTAASAALAITAWVMPGLALASTKPIQAIQLRLPLNASSNAQGLLFGADCVGAGSCTAGGSYVDRSGHTQAMVVAESGGRWARPVELRLPPKADPDPFAQVNSVDCTGTSSCVAVGFYDSAGRPQSYAATESRGRWHRALLISPPPNSASPPDFQLNGVACTGQGSCVAVGSYLDSSGLSEGLVAVESKGSWARARELSLPSNAGTNPSATFGSVACTRIGSCVAAGDYADKSGFIQVAIATESAGRWRGTTQIKLPEHAAAVPMAEVKAVTCAGTGFCITVGRYQDTSEKEDSFAATRTARGWARAIRIAALPANATANSNTFASSVACTRAGFCAETGEYIDKANGLASLAAFESKGKWTKAIEVLSPSNGAVGAARNTNLTAASCTTFGYCLVVGDYRAKSGLVKPMAAKAPAP
jgi:ferredoxin